MADGKKIMPHVLELSFGVDRNVWMLVDVFYKKDGERKRAHAEAWLAPYQPRYSRCRRTRR